jgi:hypothetical protein
VFEYVIATNNVPLTGGNLTFKGTSAGGGVKNSFMLNQHQQEEKEHFKLSGYLNILI